MVGDLVLRQVVQLHPAWVNSLQSARVFETLLQVTEEREEPPVPLLPTVEAPLVQEDDLHRGGQRLNVTPQQGDDLVICQHVEYFPRLQIVVQSCSLLCREARVLQISVANHLGIQFVEALGSLQCPSRVFGRIYGLFALKKEGLQLILNLILKVC